MAENRKAWVESELIVLVRSKPEETVLAACKGDGPPTSSGSGWMMCSVDCANCHDTGTS